MQDQHASGARPRWSRYLLPSLGVALVCLLAAVTIWPTLRLFVLEQFVLPMYYADFGFRGGEVPAGTPDSRHVLYTFVEVVPGGRLSQAGVRTGDVPMDLEAFRSALRTAAAGGIASFDVLARPDWPRRDKVRRIVLGKTPVGGSP